MGDRKKFSFLLFVFGWVGKVKWKPLLFCWEEKWKEAEGLYHALSVWDFKREIVRVMELAAYCNYLLKNENIEHCVCMNLFSCPYYIFFKK